MDRENMYANQKTVTINKESTEFKRFASVHLQNLDDAMATLTPNTFKLWVYFAKNIDGYELVLYRSNVMRKCKFGASTYTKAMQELINLKYLIPTEDGKGYDFYDSPRETSDCIITIQVLCKQYFYKNCQNLVRRQTKDQDKGFSYRKKSTPS